MKTTTKKKRTASLLLLTFTLTLRGLAGTSFLETAHPETAPGKFLYEYSQLEEAGLKGRIHEARDRQDSLESRCQAAQSAQFQTVPTPDRGLVAAACALSAAEAGRHERARAYLDIVAANPMPQDDRWFFEGRLALIYQDFRRATVPLEFLRRKRPKSARALFWLARTHQLQGNRGKADELYDDLERLGDFRASFRRSPAAVDGWHYGIRPGIFAGFPDDFGGFVSLFDDRAFDTDREVTAQLLATIRGSFGVVGHYDDGEIFPPARVTLDGSLQRRERYFNGLGMASAKDEFTRYRESFATLAVGANREVVAPLRFGVGWRSRFELVKDFSPGFAPLPSHTGGPVGWLELDTRDSRVRPWVGGLARVEGYFPTKGLGSEVTFERWRAEVQGYWKLAARHRISVGAALEQVSSGSPLWAYPDLGALLGWPGVYTSRFRERSGTRAALEYQNRLGSQLTLGVYGTTGTMAPDVGDLVRAVWKAGGGGTLEWQVGQYRGSSARFEVGRFGEEWVIQVVAGVAW